MQKDSELRNQLKAVRTRLGLSQAELAQAAGIARQTVGGIEAGTYALSMVVALRLARALGCAVEELFWLEGDLPTIEADVLGGGLPRPTDAANDGERASVRVALATVGGRWIATPLVGAQAYRGEMVPADGIAEGMPAPATGRLTVRLLDAPDALESTLLLAGCTPALSLLARAAERRHPGLRVHWTYANSSDALAHLARGDVHLAGVHFSDANAGNADDHTNAAFVRATLSPDVPAVLVHLGVWEEGFVVAPGNPKGIHTAADLIRPDIILINREPGAAARLLLDTLLQRENIPAATVTGYDTLAPGGHFEVAQTIRAGRADVGITTRATAAACGLDFLPLQSVRYDLALRRESLQLPAIGQLLGTLQHRWVLSQLAIVAGYDTARTGEIVEV